jgi:anti-sigma regulatory factor (Ser/Thr protein kinase)
VTSELVTNAVRHTEGAEPPTLFVRIRAYRVELSVSSESAQFGPPGCMSESPGQHGGFGLRLVEAITDSWWVEHDDRTRVVCELLL